MKKILEKCKCGVYLTVNSHKDTYDSVETYITDLFSFNEDDNINEDIGEDVYKEMIKRDTIIELQFYPNTPVGFYKIYHYDLDMAIKEALEILKQ